MTTARQTRQTPKKKDRFIDALRSTGNVSEAADAAGLHRTFVYQLRKEDPDFAAAWDDALDTAADVMEREAFRRAVEGTEKPVFGSMGFRMGTGEVGRIREYSDTLLIFLLKGARPEKYRERGEMKHVSDPVDWDRVPPDVRDAFIDGKVSLDDVRRLVSRVH